MDPYEILGVERNASEEEINNKFRETIEECINNQDENTKQKIQNLNAAYNLIINEKMYKEVRELIDNRSYFDAEAKLNTINNSNSAEWNYLQGFIAVQKGWFENGLKYIKKATELDPGNLEYLDSLNKLQSRVINYMKNYTKKNVKPNSNNVNGCGGNNNGNSNGGMC